MDRAGIFQRVSSTGQDETSQTPDNERWADTHKYDIKTRYTIHGKSAFKGNKKFDETWAQVLDDFKSGTITVLIVWKSDRIDRKLNTFKMIADVVALGGRVEFVTQPHLNDLSTMGGRIALKVQEEIAYAESKDKSDRILAKHANLRSNGSVTRRPPWGYTVTKTYPKTYVPTDEARRLIPEMFRRVIAQSLQDVADWMSAETGHEFWARTIAMYVRDSVYIGYIPDGDKIIRCEALVDAQTFERAGKALAARPKRGPIVKENRAMLSTVLFCPACQDTLDKLVKPSPMNRLNTGYYRCTGRGRARKGCGNMVKTEIVDSWVDEQIKTRWATPIITRRFIPGHNHDAEIADVQYQLDHLASQHLDDDAEDLERMRLRGEKKRLANLPATPDSWVDVQADHTYADEWNDLPNCERAEWLSARGIVVMFAKDQRGMTLDRARIAA